MQSSFFWLSHTLAERLKIKHRNVVFVYPLYPKVMGVETEVYNVIIRINVILQIQILRTYFKSVSNVYLDATRL